LLEERQFYDANGERSVTMNTIGKRRRPRRRVPASVAFAF
jgi:hypothetical protein